MEENSSCSLHPPRWTRQIWCLLQTSNPPQTSPSHCPQKGGFNNGSNLWFYKVLQWLTNHAGWSPPYQIQILVKLGSTQASRCSGMPWREKVLKKISHRWQYPYLTGWQWGPEDISAKDMDHIIKVWVDHVKLFLYLLHRSTTQTMKMHGRRSWSGRGFTRQSVPNPRWGNFI